MLSGLVVIAFGLFLSATLLFAPVGVVMIASVATLRRTFCSLLYAAQHSPPYVMDQIGHASATLTLETYANVMKLGKEDGPIDDLVASFGTRPEKTPNR